MKKGARRGNTSPAGAPEYTRFCPWVSADQRVPVDERPVPGGRGRNGKVRPEEPNAMAASGPGTRPTRTGRVGAAGFEPATP